VIHETIAARASLGIQGNPDLGARVAHLLGFQLAVMRAHKIGARLSR
jgi:hypothetical protein